MYVIVRCFFGYKSEQDRKINIYEGNLGYVVYFTLGRRSQSEHYNSYDIQRTNKAIIIPDTKDNSTHFRVHAVHFTCVCRYKLNSGKLLKIIYGNRRSFQILNLRWQKRKDVDNLEIGELSSTLRWNHDLFQN